MRVVENTPGRLVLQSGSLRLLLGLGGLFLLLAALAMRASVQGATGLAGFLALAAAGTAACIARFARRDTARFDRAGGCVTLGRIALMRQHESRLPLAGLQEARPGPDGRVLLVWRDGGTRPLPASPAAAAAVNDWLAQGEVR